ncbi:hypothetical protein EVAR_42995_1 [Eumeta japonica]|uniref:Uncharacterized protein n=1 Tax=Eumeta variegata TaxID=151549 RepID=A0A4C1WDS0_EUMVA|nr:hypothetical protein EVAR_42995_1 [Eumeta japonica]
MYMRKCRFSSGEGAPAHVRRTKCWDSSRAVLIIILTRVVKQPIAHRPALITRRAMAACACAILFLIHLARVNSQGDCMKLTLSDNIHNRTLLRVIPKNESVGYKYQVLDLWRKFPTVLAPRNGTSEQCRRDSDRFLKGLQNVEMWALKST